MRRIAAALLCLLLLTGCSQEIVEPEENSLDEFFQAQQEQPEEDPGPDYPAAFSLAYHKDHTLDPITCGEGIQQDVASLLFEPLFRLDSSFSPVPLLCEGYSWDESYLVLTLDLRQDVTFSDGTELKASDVVASLNRAAASERYGYRLRNVVSISSNRSGQVVITLAAPNSGFVSLLDIPITKRGTENQPVPTGTGPYLFVTGSAGNSLVANDAWWQGKALPVQTIPLIHAKDQDTAMYLFSSHRAELLTVDPTANQVAATGQVESTNIPTSVMQFVGFNTAEGRVFASTAARVAFSAGLQRDKLVDAFLSGHAEAAQFPISPLSELYPADLEQPYSYESLLSALSAAGQDTGETVPLKLLVNEENSFRVANAQFIAESMSLLDWQITVQVLPWEEYLEALTAGDFDLYYGEVRLTADWDLTDLIGTGGAMNYGGYANGITDLLLLNWSSASDRQASARQLCSYLRANAPIAPLCFKSNTVLTHTGVVEGLAPAPSATFYALEDWVIHLDSEP